MKKKENTKKKKIRKKRTTHIKRMLYKYLCGSSNLNVV